MRHLPLALGVCVAYLGGSLVEWAYGGTREALLGGACGCLVTLAAAAAVDLLGRRR